MTHAEACHMGTARDAVFAPERPCQICSLLPPTRRYMLANYATRTDRMLGKARRHSSHSWAALEQLVQLAGAAQIPLGGGAFGIASEVIQIFNVSDSF